MLHAGPRLSFPRLSLPRLLSLPMLPSFEPEAAVDPSNRISKLTNSGLVISSAFMALSTSRSTSNEPRLMVSPWLRLPLLSFLRWRRRPGTGGGERLDVDAPDPTEGDAAPGPGFPEDARLAILSRMLRLAAPFAGSPDGVPPPPPPPPSPGDRAAFAAARRAVRSAVLRTDDLDRCAADAVGSARILLPGRACARPPAPPRGGVPLPPPPSGGGGGGPVPPPAPRILARATRPLLSPRAMPTSAACRRTLSLGAAHSSPPAAGDDEDCRRLCHAADLLADGEGRAAAAGEGAGAGMPSPS